jgi:hypothetical protein
MSLELEGWFKLWILVEISGIVSLVRDAIQTLLHFAIFGDESSCQSLGGDPSLTSPKFPL